MAPEDRIFPGMLVFAVVAAENGLINWTVAHNGNV